MFALRNAPDQQYRTQEFAKLAGVTVRALHHYDELDLLKPRRSAAGYRIYRSVDMERLEQIVALKFIGIPLRQIKLLLDRNPLALPEALRAQRAALEGKREILGHAIRAIQEAERSLEPGKPADAAQLKRIIEVMEMEEKTQWAEKYYTPEAQAKIDERKKLWSPELQEEVSKQWTELFSDVRAALDQDPASARAQELAGRWKTLVERFTGGDASITQGLNRLYQDRENWPASAKQQMSPYSDPKIWDFIKKAMAATKSE